jgi:hypothetical protein
MEMGPAKRGQSEDIQQCEFCACWTHDGLLTQADGVMCDSPDFYPPAA